MSLADQILQRWGRYGDWRSADQDQAADLARLFEANGISDLGKLQFAPRQYEIAPNTWETEAGTLSDGGAKGTAFDVTYDGRPVSFLGDINRDGAVEMKSGGEFGQGRGSLRGDGNLLGWSARGGGNTSFFLRQDPSTGQTVVVPTWGSSSAETYGDLRGIASIAALAAGGHYAGAGGTTGAAAQGALQGQGLATGAAMLGDGDVDSLTKAGLAGAVTGAIGGGIKGFGAEQGWNPSTTRALTGGANAALRGGDGGDIAKAAAMGWLQNAGGQAINQSGNGGGNMDWNFDTAGSYDPSIFDFGQDAFANPDAYQVDWNSALNGIDPGTLTGNYWGQDGGGLDWTALLKRGAGWLLGNGGKGGQGGNALLPALLGALGGYFDSKDTTQTQNRGPWEPAQPYLQGLLREGAGLYGQYQMQPFSQAQQTAYGNVGGLLDVLNANAGGLLQGMQANATGQNQFVRGQPQHLVGSAPINGDLFTPGLLGSFGTRRG